MSKTINDTSRAELHALDNTEISRNVREPKERELMDVEVAHVSGGATLAAKWDIKPNKRV